MRVLVTISRSYDDTATIYSALNACLADARELREPLVLVHGDYRSRNRIVSDAIAEQWARINGITTDPYPAENYGPWPACGPKRNQAMVNTGAHLCLAFIGPCTSPRCQRTDPHHSHGATDCATRAEAAGIPVRRWTT